MVFIDLPLGPAPAPDGIEFPLPKLCHPPCSSAALERTLPMLACPVPVLLCPTSVRVEALAPDLALPEGEAPLRAESCITCCMRAACS